MLKNTKNSCLFVNYEKKFMVDFLSYQSLVIDKILSMENVSTFGYPIPFNPFMSLVFNKEESTLNYFSFQNTSDFVYFAIDRGISKSIIEQLRKMIQLSNKKIYYISASYSKDISSFVDQINQVERNSKNDELIVFNKIIGLLNTLYNKNKSTYAISGTLSSYSLDFENDKKLTTIKKELVTTIFNEDPSFVDLIKKS